ncbi:MAG: hypothetical protein FWG70_09730 [Oscillospiraceae bacterium]|nr:hypothetical protein [Oscillospiraceae bacterium]
MKNCTKCNAEIPDNMQFCGSCGVENSISDSGQQYMVQPAIITPLKKKKPLPLLIGGGVAFAVLIAVVIALGLNLRDDSGDSLPSRDRDNDSVVAVEDEPDYEMNNINMLNGEVIDTELFSITLHENWRVNLIDDEYNEYHISTIHENRDATIFIYAAGVRDNDLDVFEQFKKDYLEMSADEFAYEYFGNEVNVNKVERIKVNEHDALRIEFSDYFGGPERFSVHDDNPSVVVSVIGDNTVCSITIYFNYEDELSEFEDMLATLKLKPYDINKDNKAVSETPVVPVNHEKQDLRIWSFTDEIPNAVLRYVEMNPDSIVADFNIVTTILYDWNGDYESAIKPALEAGGSNAPDFYMAEQAFALTFTKGAYSSFAMPYNELIDDFDFKLTNAQLSQHTVNTGTRGEGKIIALSEHDMASCLIYRRSIAMEVWGTDDPAVIAAKTGPGLDKFTEAAAAVSDAGYAMICSEDDLWQVARNGATQPWIDSGNRLIIDPARESYFELAKTFFDNGYISDNAWGAWSDQWFAGISGTRTPEVFSYIGPSWLLNYQINEFALEGSTFGDWAVTDSPIPWAWGGNWLFANKDLEGDKKAAVAELIEWFTLDTSNNGYQYHFANGTLYEGSIMFPNEAREAANGTTPKLAVPSKVVMEKSAGNLAVVGGQNVFEYYLPAGQSASSDHLHELDIDLNNEFHKQCRMYYNGEKSKEEAVQDFKIWANQNFRVSID